MVEPEKVLQKIVDQVYEKVKYDDVSMEDLYAAAVTLLNVREYSKPDVQILSGKENNG